MSAEFVNCPSYIFKHPCSILISGVSMSGKSTFTLKLLNEIDKLFDVTPQKIVLSYSENATQYTNNNLPIQMIHGLDFPTENYERVPTIIIIDDQMEEGANSNKIQELFTRGVHHRDTSVIFITQNLFGKGKHARDIRLNAHYMVIFKSPTFVSQVMYLGRVIFPDKKKLFNRRL